MTQGLKLWNHLAVGGKHFAFNLGNKQTNRLGILDGTELY